MQYVTVPVVAAKDGGEEGSCVSDNDKTEFFKLYVKLSRKTKKLVGKKKNGKEIKANFDKMLEAMRFLVDA